MSDDIRWFRMSPVHRYAWCAECSASIRGVGELVHREDCPALKRKAPTVVVTSVDREKGVITISDGSGY